MLSGNYLKCAALVWNLRLSTLFPLLARCCCARAVLESQRALCISDPTQKDPGASSLNYVGMGKAQLKGDSRRLVGIELQKLHSDSGFPEDAHRRAGDFHLDVPSCRLFGNSSLAQLNKQRHGKPILTLWLTRGIMHLEMEGNLQLPRLKKA